MGDLLALEKRMQAFISDQIRSFAEKPKPLYYTANEAARISGLSAQAIRKRLRDPEERHLKGIQKEGGGTTWLVLAKSLDEWLEFRQGGGQRA